MSIFYYLSLAFTIWMVIDAARRRAEFFWYVIIILFMPFGGLIYFAVIKLKDFELGKLGNALPAETSGVELGRLEAAVLETPSVVNKLALADALTDRERWDDAMPLYREVVARDPDDKQARHGLARCLLASGKAGDSLEHFEELLGKDRAYRDYSAALEYAEALWQSGRSEDTIDLMTGLVNVCPYINHRLALAHYLAESGRPERAHEVIHEALEAYESGPAYTKKRDRDWARHAKKMLSEIKAKAN